MNCAEEKRILQRRVRELEAENEALKDSVRAAIEQIGAALNRSSVQRSATDGR